MFFLVPLPLPPLVERRLEHQSLCQLQFFALRIERKRTQAFKRWRETENRQGRCLQRAFNFATSHVLLVMFTPTPLIYE
jgi:hypothetical protein